MKMSTAARLWLNSKEDDVALTKSTMKGYRTNVKCINHFLGNLKVSNIKRSDIKYFLNVKLVNNSIRWGSKQGNTTKTRRNVRVVLNGIFEHLFDDGKISTNPMSNPIKIIVTGRSADTNSDGSPLPDPFDKNEITKVLRTETEYQQGVNAFNFDCLTGLRLCELIALTWDDLYLHMQDGQEVPVLYVRKSNVLGEYKPTKTDRSCRQIPLTDNAYNILVEQKLLTADQPDVEYYIHVDDKTIKQRMGKFIFLNDNDCQPWKSVDHFRTEFFKPHVKKSNVRYRGPNQARHTYATNLVQNNINMAWIAQMLGHSNMKMLEQRYASWKPRRYSLSNLALAEQALSIAA